MSGITFTVTDATSTEALWAMSQYFEELDRRFANGFAAGAALEEALVMFKPPVGVVVVASDGGVTVGCGAIHFWDDTTGEIKRMWISGTVRGVGLGKRLLAFLEEQVARSGRTRVVLDTNASLVEAIAMYRSCGYRSIGRYNDNPYADLWFEKQVDQGCHPTELPGH